ncbi:MAG: hypothetical protein J7L14_03595 [Candidatus Diapherotrites archaeon]|nr:hypothetical protein [Candidatus Diapherotrites archaeon]
MSERVPDWAQQLWDIVFSLNRLVARDKGTEPLLAFYYPENDRRREPPLEDYKSCRDKLEELLTCSAELGLSDHRRRYLIDVTTALIVQAEEGMGRPRSYGELVASYLGVPGQPVPQDTVVQLQEKLADALAMAGVRGSLERAMERWRITARIPPSELANRGVELLEQARKTTHDRVVQLPAKARMELELAHDVYYRGYSHALDSYRGKIMLNADLPWTQAELKALLAHEGCPGHFALNVLRLHQAEEGRLPPECAFYFANTPITPVVEGTCNLGVYLLSWFRTVDDLVVWRYELLRAALLTNMCFMAYEEGANDAFLERYFESHGGGDEVAAKQAVRFVRHPLWRTSIPHYWYGTTLAFAAYKRALQRDDPNWLRRELFARVHTYGTLSSSLAMCGDATSI